MDGIPGKTMVLGVHTYVIRFTETASRQQRISKSRVIFIYFSFVTLQQHVSALRFGVASCVFYTYLHSIGNHCYSLSFSCLVLVYL